MLLLTLLMIALIIWVIRLGSEQSRLSAKVNQLQEEVLRLRSMVQENKPSEAPAETAQEVPFNSLEDEAVPPPSSDKKSDPIEEAAPVHLPIGKGAQPAKVDSISMESLHETPSLSEIEKEKEIPPASEDGKETTEKSHQDTDPLLTSSPEGPSLPPALEKSELSSKSDKTTETPLEDPALDQPAATSDPSQPAAVATSKPKSRVDWELLIGGKWLNRIGALALFISLSFFLKYAFDQNWLNEIVRVSLGGVTGAALLYGGYRTHAKKLTIFAQGLVGAGIAILYVTIYVSFNFYHLIPQTLAFLLMSGITALAFQQALRYNSLAVSLLGWAGGFLTPFLISTGEASPIGLFIFLSLLLTGMLLVLIKREKWIILFPLSLMATYLIYGFWFLSDYHVEVFFPGVFFLTLFWGIFLFFDLWSIVRQIKSYLVLRRIFFGINAGFYSFYMTALLQTMFPVWKSATTLTIGAFYLLIAQILKKRATVQSGVLAQYTLTALLFATLATAQEFSGYTLTLLFALEALALAWYGLRSQIRYLWIMAISLYGVTILQLLFQVGKQSLVGEPLIPIWNRQTLAFFILAASLGVAAFLFQRSKAASPLIYKGLHIGGAVILILWTMFEFTGFKLTILLTLQALAHVIYGIRFQGRYMWITSLSIFGITVFQLLAQVGKQSLVGEPLTPIWNMQTLAFFILAASLGITAFLFQRSKAASTLIHQGLNLGWALLVILWSVLEFSGYELTIVLSLHALALTWYGIHSQGRYMWITSLSIFGITVFHLLAQVGKQSFVSEPLTPIWNMQTLAFFTLTTSLGIASFFFRRVGDSVTFAIHRWLQFGWVFLVILWSILEFSGYTLTILLTLQALILVGYGIRSQSRDMWITALSLFGFPIFHLMVQLGEQLIWVKASYTPIWNLQTLAFFVLIASLIITLFLFRRISGSFAPVIRKALHLVWSLLLFIWCTAEVVLFFNSLLSGTRGDLFVHLSYKRTLVTAVVWLFYGMLLVWIGLYRRNNVLFFVGVGGFSIAALPSALWGFTYQPIALFTPILNLRFAVMLLIAIGVFFLGRWLIKKRPFEKVDLWRRILHVGIALFIFELISVEIRDGFDQALYALDLSFAKAQRLENMKQLLMSLAWILYSFSLLIIGMWRKVQTMRLLAISLLGLSILKIFIIDLAFLDTLYRIFSFMVLGLILLGISYVYGKYKDWFKRNS